VVLQTEREGLSITAHTADTDAQNRKTGSDECIGSDANGLKKSENMHVPHLLLSHCHHCFYCLWLCSVPKKNTLQAKDFSSH
jgi:hypothetical protein